MVTHPYDDISDDTLIEIGLPQALFTEAGTGSIVAQRRLRDLALRLALLGTEPFAEAFTVAECYARMVSGRGGAGDQIKLAEMLLIRAERLARTDGHARGTVAQAVALLDAAADDGESTAADMMTVLWNAGVDRAVFDLAVELRAGGATS